MPPHGFVQIAASTQTGCSGRILVIAVDPDDPNTVYIGTDGGGIFKTIAAYLNPIPWQWVGKPETGLSNGVVRDIQINTSQTSIIYAATNGGVFRSIGGGGYWDNMSISKEIMREDLGILDTSPAVSTWVNGLSKTYTLGYASTKNRAKTNVYLDGEETPNYIFANDQSIKFITQNLTDGADISIDYWTGDVLPIRYPVYALAIDPNDTDPVNHSAIYAGTYGDGIYVSTDGGFT